MIGPDHWPPGLSVIPVDTIRAHGHPRFEFFIERTVSKSVKDKAVQPLTESPVSLIFHITRIFFPGFLRPSRKSFGCHNRSTSYMSNRSGLNYAERRIVAKAITPELTHRHISRRPQVKIRGGIHVIRLNGKLKAIFPAKLFKLEGVIFNNQLA